MQCFTPPISKELNLALNAARTAISICNKSPRQIYNIKNDNSPVSLADVTIQATVRHMIHEIFPNDTLLGEEVIETSSIIEHLEFTPLNNYSTSGRTWILDPIDGTAGFLSGGYYAFGLCLPNVVTSLAIPKEGLILLVEDEMEVITVCKGAQPPVGGWLLSGGNGAIPRLGKLRKLCCGSLVKYAAVARGQADVFVQVVKTGVHVWDHAAGIAVVKASGGAVSDEHGAEIMVSERLVLQGHTIIASKKGMNHDRVCEIVREALKNGMIS